MCKCFCMLISKRGSRHSRVHFFNDSTSKSAPMLRCFSPVHFEVCSAPQQHPLFEHLNLQKCSGNGVFCTFCIRILLCATTACTFSTSQFLPVLRSWRALCILTSKCALHHNGVHFFDISIPTSAQKLTCFVHFDFEMCFAPQGRALFRHLNSYQCSEADVLCAFWLRNVLCTTTACTFSTSQFLPVLRSWRALFILTSKCALRHKGVHFFDISIPTSAQKLTCFVHFDFEMCFAPQRRALFRHLNSYQCSEADVLCSFWLRNVLCATRACTFSTSQFLPVLRSWRALFILTSKCALRHTGVHFFDISIPTSAQKLACFVHFDFEMCFAPQRRALFRHLNSYQCSEADVLCSFWLRNVLCATRACTFSTSQFLPVLRSRRALFILTSQCPLHHNGVHFFDISIPTSAQKPTCFVHFDFDMCFAPQRRALFRHLNSYQCSEADVLCAFWLRNVLCTTTACTFSTSQFLPVLRSRRALFILTSKCALRHKGVQFLISHLAKWLRTHRLSEPTFRASEPQNSGKMALRDFSTFSRALIFWFFLFPDSSHLVCFICPYCRKFDFQTSFDNPRGFVWYNYCNHPQISWLIIISLKSCHISFFLNVVFLQRIASTPAVHQWRGKLNHFSLARSGTKVSRKTVFSILAESGPVKLASSAGKHVVPWFTIVISIYKNNIDLPISYI